LETVNIFVKGVYNGIYSLIYNWNVFKRRASAAIHLKFTKGIAALSKVPRPQSAPSSVSNVERVESAEVKFIVVLRTWQREGSETVE
jgi:hypothetical protein